MSKHLIIVLFLLVNLSVLGQVRNGWRSVYDRDGRLTRMNFYQRGISIIDSSMYFQYYTDNIIKAYITGDVVPQTGEVTGFMALFDHAGNLTSYSNRIKGETLFDLRCTYEGSCQAIWNDNFKELNSDWLCGDFSLYENQMIIHNHTNLGIAVYQPDIPLDLSKPFTCSIDIPTKGNSVKQGIALGWKDENNHLLVELTHGQFISINELVNGEANELIKGRREIELKGDQNNIITLKYNGTTLIIEVNGRIEMVMQSPIFRGEQIALITRSRGDARYSNFVFSRQLPDNDEFFDHLWLGKGTGFFVTPRRIVTTYDVISEARKIRVRGKIDGKQFLLAAKLVRVEESNNLAILEIEDTGFNAFAQLPFGFSAQMPVSESSAFGIGFPNAISTIYMDPEVYEGKVLPTSSLTSGYRLLEMSFRFGMMGSPVFDKDANLLGITAYKGLDLKYTEIIDFQHNSRILKAILGRFDREIEAPIKNMTMQEKIKVLSEVVVIIESSAFGEKAIEN